MLKILIIGILNDLQNLIRQNVFEVSHTARRASIDTILGENYPEVLKEYFTNVSSDDLYKDTLHLLKFISSGRFSTAQSPLFKAIQSFIVKNLPTIKKSGKYDSSFLRAVDSILEQGTQELDKQILLFSKRFAGVLPVRVQTATPLDTEEKNLIRNHFNEGSSTLHHITFTTDSSLLGGMRIFKDGQLFDASLATRIISRTFTH